MLRSYGRLLTSSLTRRCASTAVATEPEAATNAPRRVRSHEKDANERANFSLAERQATLEASLQRKVRAPVRRGRKAAEPLTDGDARVVPAAVDAVDPPKPKRRVKKLPEESSDTPKKPVTRKKKTTSETVAPVTTKALARSIAEVNSDTPKSKKRTEKAPTIPPRLLPPPEQKHHDLPTFLTHATRNNLNTNSTVYRGTHYEYTVASALKSLNFTLHRTGRSNDLGIDLVGHWSLPTSHTRKKKTYEVPVILQCKAARSTPSMIRELEGAYTGAPAGWRGEGVLALLTNVQPSTKGVREAVQRSRWPLGVLQVTREGEVKQFLWNAVAAEIGLEGLGVAVRYASKRGGLLQAGEGEEREESMSTASASSIGLTWMGKPWVPSGVQLALSDGADTRALLTP